MRSDMKRHMQMHARDGSDVSLLLACSEQGTDSFDGIAGDPDALTALREKAGTIEVKRAERTRRVVVKVSEYQIYFLVTEFLFRIVKDFQVTEHLPLIY